MSRLNITKGPAKDQLILEKIEGPILTLTLNRPEARNAFNFDLGQALVTSLKRARTRKGLRVLVLRGAQQTFSAGGDLKLFHQNLKTSDKAFRRITTLLNQAIAEIQKIPLPVVGAIEGSAFAAGFGLALACDLLVASQHAKLSPSFINIALAPNASSSYFLPRLLGKAQATEAFMRARVFSASEALSLGLLNHVWSEEAFEEELRRFCADLAQRPAGTLSRIKKMMNDSLKNSLAQQLQLEKSEIAASSLHPDFTEGVSAFIEKRAPKFSK